MLVWTSFHVRAAVLLGCHVWTRLDVRAAVWLEVSIVMLSWNVLRRPAPTYVCAFGRMSYEGRMGSRKKVCEVSFMSERLCGWRGPP